MYMYYVIVCLYLSFFIVILRIKFLYKVKVGKRFCFSLKFVLYYKYLLIYFLEIVV